MKPTPAIRSATLDDVPGIAEVVVSTWKTSYREMVPEEYLTELTPHNQIARYQRKIQSPVPGYGLFVAVDTANQVVGFASGGALVDPKPHYDCELFAAYVLEEQQGQGVGRQLVYTLADHLHRNGFRAMLTWMLKLNPWRGFYVSLGARKVGTRKLNMNGILLEQLAYGWPDLGSLLGRST